MTKAMTESAIIATKALILTLGLWVSSANAQPYSINWSKVVGGGGSSAGGVFSLSGTIGQPEVSNTASGGNFALSPGFWSIFAVQTTGAPALTIKRTSDTTAQISWPSPSTGFNLQVSINLTVWTTPPETVQNDGSVKFILVNPIAGNRYYRLKSP